MRQWFIFFFLAILACLIGFAIIIWRISKSPNNRCDVVASYSVFTAYSKNCNSQGVDKFYFETALKYCNNEWIIANEDGDSSIKRNYAWFMDISDRILLLLPSAIKNKQKTVPLLRIGSSEEKFFNINKDGSASYFSWECNKYSEWSLFEMNIEMW